ncbi:MAG: PAS domain S-box protein, partial [Promethearchaeota archaeon]
MVEKNETVIQKEKECLELKETNKKLLNEIQHLRETNNRQTHEIEARKLAQHGLREGEKFLQTTLSSLEDTLVAVLDNTGMINFLWGSKKLEKKLGIKYGEKMGKYTEEFLQEVPKDVKMELIRRVFKTGKSIRQEWELFRPSGKVWLDFSISRIEENGNDIEGIVVTARDITERKKMEQELSLNEYRLEVLLKLNEMTDKSLQDVTDFALEEAVKLTQSEIGYIAFVNKDETVLSMHSWSKTTMEQCKINDKPVKYPIKTIGLLGDAIRERKPIITNDYSSPNPHKKGYPEGHIPIKRYMTVPVFDSQRIVAVVGVGNKEEEYDQSDVRQLALLVQGMWRLIDRKKTADKLRENEEKYRTIFENSPVGFFTFDKNLQILDENPKVKKIMGLPDTEESMVIGVNIRDLTSVLETGVPIDELIKKLREGKEIKLESPFKSLYGKESYLRVLLVPLHNQGNFDGVIMMVEDISERKQAEQKLEEYSNELEMILDNIPGLIFYKDTKNNFIRVNKALAYAHNMSKEELAGKSLFDLYPRNEAQAYWDDDLELIKNGQPQINIIEPWYTEKGRRWVNTNKIPIK